jgi:hypothetical protein
VARTAHGEVVFDHRGDDVSVVADEYPAVARYAYERPLVWFDDDFGLHPERNREFVHKRRQLTTVLVHVDPRTGITQQHLSEAREAIGGNP